MKTYTTEIAMLAILALCAEFTTQQDPCTNYINKYSESENRSPFFTVNYTNVLCDMSIETDQWLSFYAPGLQSYGLKIPEKCVEPYHCGTLLPIWIQGKHPDASNPGPIVVLACHSSYPIPDCCGWSARIQVKWCPPGFYVYTLQRPEICYSAYCFDNNGSLVPDQTAPPLLKPEIRAPFISEYKPVLWSFKRTDGTTGLYNFNATKFSVGCSVKFEDGFTQMNFSENGSPVIEVNLLVLEGDNLRPLLPQPFINRSYSPIEFLIGEEYIAGNLDKPIRCSAISYWSNHPEMSSHILYSEEIKLEFLIKTNPPREVKEDRVIILDERATLELRLEPNFPVTFGHCFDQSVWPTCKPYQFLTRFGAGINAVLHECAINVFPEVDLPAEVDHRDSIMYISAPQTLGTRNVPFIVEIDFLPVALFPATNSIFNYQYRMPSIYITITDTQQRPICSSNTDPHIRPFPLEANGIPYGMNYDMLTEPGDFYLVKLENSRRTFEIQVQHRNCLTSYVTVMCNCGVFIREGNNVIGINNCGSSVFLPRIVHYQTAIYDANGFKLPAPILEEQETDQKRHVTLLSGIEVTVTNYKKTGNLDIQVIGLAYEVYSGLCAPGTNESTAEQYRVPEQDSLFNHIADCVDEDIPFSRCDCAQNGTSSNLVSQVCKTTEPLATLTVKTECNNNVTVTGPDNTGVLPPIRNNRSVEETSDPYSLLVPASVVLSPIPAGNSTAQLNNKWPTPTTGITEQQAISKCKNVFEKSPAYSQCAEYATGLMDSCLRDIQVTEGLDIADVYISQLNLMCQTSVESNIIENADGTSVNGTDKLLQEIKSVLCPADCSYKNETRGVCVNGTCHCNYGYKGMDCSIKIGDPPTIINFFQDVIDYTSDNTSSDDGYLLLVESENVDSVNVTDLTCRITISSEVGQDSQKIQTYPGVRLLGGLVACRIKPDQPLSDPIYHANVSLSNDGKTYSNEKPVVFIDGNCTQCNNQSDCHLEILLFSLSILITLYSNIDHIQRVC